MRKKVTVVGAGNVGASCAVQLAHRGLADVVVVDVLEGIPQGKGLDIAESAPVDGFDARFTGANSYEALDGAKVCVQAGTTTKDNVVDYFAQNGMKKEDVIRAFRGFNAYAEPFRRESEAYER